MRASEPGIHPGLGVVSPVIDMSGIAMRLSADVVLRRLSAALLLTSACTSPCGAAAGLRLAQAVPPAATAPAAAAAPVPAEPAAGEDGKAESLGTPAVVIDGQAAESLLGKKVQSAKDEDLGRIVDVIVDKAGQIRAAIVDFGGFLGVGSRKIAVDWRAIHMTPDGKLDHLVISLPQDQLRSAPVYKEGEPVVVIGPPAAPVKAPAASPMPPRVAAPDAPAK